MAGLLLKPLGSGAAPFELLITLWFVAGVFLIGIVVAAVRGTLAPRGKAISVLVALALGLGFAFPFGLMLDVGCLVAAALMIYMCTSRLVRWPEKALVLASGAWFSFLLVTSVAQVALSRVHPMTLPEAKILAANSLEAYRGSSRSDVEPYTLKSTERLNDGAWAFNYESASLPKDSVYFIVDPYGNVEQEGGQ